MCSKGSSFYQISYELCIDIPRVSRIYTAYDWRKFTYLLFTRGEHVSGQSDCTSCSGPRGGLYPARMTAYQTLRTKTQTDSSKLCSPPLHQIDCSQLFTQINLVSNEFVRSRATVVSLIAASRQPSRISARLTNPPTRLALSTTSPFLFFRLGPQTKNTEKADSRFSRVGENLLSDRPSPSFRLDVPPRIYGRSAPSGRVILSSCTL